ncbi:hypothetical protein IGI04_003846 [Brassica rapa subsp. trilocularis]|uniref:Uncharacterized protein n=1 Tax=Brassica rapa subsp. trilocularis TaxID=1813537 RepID=A0ABQ7P330_BRACM|nr:hypothetical protein IGI04_003846 [Brassica rapa subsp. trilocularis]
MKNWKMGFLPRIRYAMKPDEAYGLVLSWDNVVLDRRPSKCVVFEDDPRDITATHNCTIMAVGLIGMIRLILQLDHEIQIIEKSPLERKLAIATIF